MEELLKYRNMVIVIYKRYEDFINFAAIFISAFFVFSGISTLAAGHFAIAFVINIIFSVLAVFTSPLVFFMLIMGACLIYLSFVSIEVALLAAVLVFLVMVFCVRILPKESLLIPALIVGFYLKIPFAVVLFGGIYFGLRAILPVGIGTFVWFLIPNIPKFVSLAPRETYTPLGMVNTLVDIYVEFVNYISVDKSWLYASLIFVAAVAVCYIIPLFSINYNREIALICAGAIMLLGFIFTISMGSVKMNLIFMILGLAVSVFVVWAIKFIDIAVDYSRCERVQFEDDDYYYYVKAVPKYITESAEELPVRKRTAQTKSVERKSPEGSRVAKPVQSKPINNAKQKMAEAYRLRAEKARRQKINEANTENQSAPPRGYNFDDDNNQ